REDENKRLISERNGSCVLSPSDYTLRATVTGRGELSRLQVHLYCRAVDRARRTDLVLEPTEVELVARFELNGCNGALVPEKDRASRRAEVWTTRTERSIPIYGRLARRREGKNITVIVNAAMGNMRSRSGTLHPFRIADGGYVNAPTGYQ